MTISPAFVRKIPKTDLHVHLDGSLRLETLVDLARERKVPLPSETPEGLESLVFRPRYANLNEYLEGFQYTVAVLQDEEALERTAFELAEDCQADGVRYLEVRFAPQLHVRPGFEAAVESDCLWSQLHIPDAHLQHPAMLPHGVAGVGAKIHDHLMDLRRIGENDTSSRLNSDLRQDLDGGRE